MITEPVTKDELISFNKQWVKQNGVDSLIEQYAEYQLYMMQTFKNYQQIIKELKNDDNQRLGNSNAS
jgi:hypothetical protein